MKLIWKLPLTRYVSDVRLISAVEERSRIQIEGRDWWFRLEFLNINIVLDMHLENGITGALSLHFDCTPCVRNLKTKRIINNVNDGDRRSNDVSHFNALELCQILIVDVKCLR